MRYKVQITEMLQRIETISASSKKEALEIVRCRYRKADIVLSTEGLVGSAEFTLLNSEI